MSFCIIIIALLSGGLNPLKARVICQSLDRGVYLLKVLASSLKEVRLASLISFLHLALAFL